MIATQSLAEQVAWACRILALEGYADLTLGHVSGRTPGEPLVQIKRRGIALGEVELDDVIPLDLSSENGFDSPEMHLEAVLHTEVYRAGPMSERSSTVIHPTPPRSRRARRRSRSSRTTECSSRDGLGVFEETPELITGSELGEAVARALGPHQAVLMRNHGVLVVGKDVRWAVLAAVTLERAVRLQAIAASLGPVAPIPRQTAERMLPEKYNDRLVDEYWAAWIRRLRRSGLGLAE